MNTRSKYAPYLADILKWRKEGKTFDQIVALLPPSLNPNSRVISSLIRRLRNRKPDPEHITIPKETFRFLLDTLSTFLGETTSSKRKGQLKGQLDEIRTLVQPPQSQSSINEQARANSDKALALAAKLKAEQEEKAQEAALTKPRPKLNTDRIELLPESPKDR